MNLILRLVDTAYEFWKLRTRWDHLLERCPSRNVFLTWEWLSTWWEFYGDGKRLLIVTAERDGALAGIAPLYVSVTNVARLMSVRQLRFLGTEMVCPDLLDFIVAEEVEEVRAALVDYVLRDLRTEWDVALLEDMSSSSQTVTTILDRVSGELLPGRLEEGRSCPFLVLPASWDELQMSLSRQFRKNIRNARKRLEASGGLAFRRITGESSIDEGMDQFIQLHQKRWQQKGLPGAFALSTFVAFHKQIASLFDKRGWLYLTLLELAGRPVAARYGFIYGRVNYAYQGGFDPEYAEHQVGLAIQSYCIEDEINQQLVEHNFLRGSNQVKLRWTSLARTSITVRFGKSDLRHMFVEADLMLDRRIKPFVMGFLPEWSVEGLRRMKQLR